MISSQPFLLFYNDANGFPTFRKETEGINVVEKLYSDYSDTTMDHFDLMMNNEADSLKKFPDLEILEKRIW